MRSYYDSTLKKDNRVWIWLPEVGQATARRADGWMLAEATLWIQAEWGGGVTSSHDGTELGKKYADILTHALINKEKLPSIMIEDVEFEYH
jgi:hypothetical protein